MPYAPLWLLSPIALIPYLLLPIFPIPIFPTLSIMAPIPDIPDVPDILDIPDPAALTRICVIERYNKPYIDPKPNGQPEKVAKRRAAAAVVPLKAPIMVPQVTPCQPQYALQSAMVSMIYKGITQCPIASHGRPLQCHSLSI